MLRRPQRSCADQLFACVVCAQSAAQPARPLASFPISGDTSTGLHQRQVIDNVDQEQVPAWAKSLIETVQSGQQRLETDIAHLRNENRELKGMLEEVIKSQRAAESKFATTEDVARVAATTTEAVVRSIENATTTTKEAVQWVGAIATTQVISYTHRLTEGETDFLFRQITDVAKMVNVVHHNMVRVAETFDSFQQEVSLQRPSTVITPVGVLVPDA